MGFRFFPFSPVWLGVWFHLEGRCCREGSIFKYRGWQRKGCRWCCFSVFIDLAITARVPVVWFTASGYTPPPPPQPPLGKLGKPAPLASRSGAGGDVEGASGCGAGRDVRICLTYGLHIRLVGPAARGDSPSTRSTYYGPGAVASSALRPHEASCRYLPPLTQGWSGSLRCRMHPRARGWDGRDDFL